MIDLTTSMQFSLVYQGHFALGDTEFMTFNELSIWYAKLVEVKKEEQELMDQSMRR